MQEIEIKPEHVAIAGGIGAIVVGGATLYFLPDILRALGVIPPAPVTVDKVEDGAGTGYAEIRARCYNRDGYMLPAFGYFTPLLPIEVNGEYLNYDSDPYYKKFAGIETEWYWWHRKFYVGTGRDVTIRVKTTYHEAVDLYPLHLESNKIYYLTCVTGAFIEPVTINLHPTWWSIRDRVDYSLVKVYAYISAGFDEFLLVDDFEYRIISPVPDVGTDTVSVKKMMGIPPEQPIWRVPPCQWHEGWYGFSFGWIYKVWGETEQMLMESKSPYRDRAEWVELYIVKRGVRYFMWGGYPKRNQDLYVRVINYA